MHFSPFKFSIDVRRIVLCSLSATLFSAPIAAQDLLEEIIVTAQKRAQNQQDVPVAVTTLSGDQLVEIGVTDMFDLQAYVPSLIVGQAQNSTTSNFAIRGVGTSSQNFGLESSVGLYVDGVYRARQSSLINEMVDVAGTEVLRGPQGSLFGRNTPSGAVLINTVAPSFDSNNSYLEVNAGNFDLRSVNGALGGVLIEDTLAVRFTGFATYRDGFVDDAQLGSDKINDRDRVGGRLQFLYTPSPDLSVRLIADHSEINEICCAAVTLYNNYFSSEGEPGSDSIFATPESVFIVPGLITGFGANIIDQTQADKRLVSYNQLPESSNEDQGITVEVNYVVGGGTLTSVSGWRSFDSQDDIDADFSTVEIFRRADQASQKSFSQEFRFTNNGDIFNYVVGAYYFQQDLSSTSNTILGADANNLIAITVFDTAQDLAAAAAAAAMAGDLNTAAQLTAQAQQTQQLGVSIVANNGFPAGGNAINQMEQDHSAWALFGHMDYALTDNLVLGLGLRYTEESKDLNGIYTEENAGFGFSLGLPDLVVINSRPNLNTDFDDDNLTGSLKLSWFATDSTMFYGSYATGYKSGGTNTDRIDPVFNSVFDAETSKALEVGMKSDITELNLRVNIALHNTVTEDYQSNTFQGTGFNLQNAAEIEARGIELETWWYPTQDLSIAAAYIYNDAEFQEFDRSSCWEASPFLLGIVDSGLVNPGDEFCDRSGTQIAGNAKNNFILSITQQFRLSNELSGNVHADFRHQDDMIMDNNADPLKLQDPFGLLNVSASLFFEDWNAELTAWVRNATDEEWYGPIFDVPLQIGKLNAYPREGRTFGLRLRVDL